MSFEAAGRLLIFFSVVLLVAGIVLVAVGRTGFRGLPGDIHIQRDSFSCFFPIVSMIVLSLLLTLIVNLVLWFWGHYRGTP